MLDSFAGGKYVNTSMTVKENNTECVDDRSQGLCNLPRTPMYKLFWPNIYDLVAVICIVGLDVSSDPPPK